MKADLDDILFRVPLDAVDRCVLNSPSAKAGDTIGWPHEALAISGVWPSMVSRRPTVRPIFPGALRFLAANPAEIPSIDQIDVVDGRVTDECLEQLALTGTLLVRVLGKTQLQKMKKAGTLPPLNEYPSIAFYGPVRLSSDFLRSALLDYERGLSPSSFYYDLKWFKPGDPGWQAIALQSFLSGNYEPPLHAKPLRGDDDAGRLPMPEVVIAADNTMSLGVALGWLKNPKAVPTAASDPNLEIVPTVPFLRHVGKKVRESVYRADEVDPLIVALFDDEDTSKPWTDRLAASCRKLGFGDMAGQMPIDYVLREFQISASGDRSAVARSSVISDSKLAERDFRDLKAQTNLFRYTGPISGRANQATRLALAQWANAAQRSPLLIPAFAAESLDLTTERPMDGAEPIFPDLWMRQETIDITLRMFAADFTRVAVDSGMDRSELEPLGNCSRWKKSESESVYGPGTLKPTAIRRVANAEVTPSRLLGISDSELLFPIPPSHPTDLAKISTFRVVRAVAEIECLGYLDQINAYDDAGVSFGPCHWSMAGAIRNPKGATELGGFAAYLRLLATNPVNTSTDVFKDQGLTAASSENARPTDDAQRASDATYRNRLSFLDDRACPVAMSEDGPRNFIPSWRSYQRWIAIGRRHPSIGKAVWAMSVRRLLAIRAVPIQLSPLPVDGRPRNGPFPTIGEVFTSELAIAQIMRWHVKVPSAVAVGSGDKLKASSYISDAYRLAEPTDPSDPAAWEAALLVSMRQQLLLFVRATDTKHAELPANFDEIANPFWIDQDVSPPVVKDNHRAYALDPRLRVLSDESGSFLQYELPE